MSDPYREGAALALGIAVEDVTRAQRDAFKTAFNETRWKLLCGSKDARKGALKQIFIIEEGLQDGWSEERLKRTLTATADA